MSETRESPKRTCPACRRPVPAKAERCACGAALREPPGTATVRAPLLGKTLDGKYEVQSVLGEGGMGIVYKVRHLLLERETFFALKVLHPRFSEDERFRARFLHEVEVAMQLTHRNVVATRDFGISKDGLLFFTMDHFEGVGLRSLVRREGPLPVPRAIAIVRQVLAALTEAHRRGIVHRDLKPDNVLVRSISGEEDLVKILDFGIAKVVQGQEAGAKNLTQGGAIGSPRYMSPEQISGEPVDGRSDLYSLGIILYELLTGKTPFNAKTTRMILMKHLTEKVPPLDQICPGLQVSRRLQSLLFRLLAKEPKNRPASAEEVLQVLDGERTVQLSVVRRHRRGLVGLGVAATVAAGAAFLLLGPFAPGLEREADAQSTTGAVPPPSVPSAPEETGSSSLAPPPSSPGRSVRSKLRCQLCSEEFFEGELLGNSHHGLPLVPVD